MNRHDDDDDDDDDDDSISYHVTYHHIVDLKRQNRLKVERDKPKLKVKM